MRNAAKWARDSSPWTVESWWLEKDEENGCEKAAERKLDAPNESTVLGLPLRSPLESEQECEAPPPGSSAKLLTANGHFVRDSSPPRVTIDLVARVPPLSALFLCLHLSFDRWRQIARNSQFPEARIANLVSSISEREVCGIGESLDR